MRDEMGDFVQTVLYNVLGNKEENTKEKDLEEITDASYPQSMEATPLSSADADFIKKLDHFFPLHFLISWAIKNKYIMNIEF